MSSIGRVQRWFDEGRLLRPTPAQPGTPHLGRAVASLCGSDIELDEPSQLLADAIGESDHYVLVLADGLGMNLVEALPEDAFFRRRLTIEMRSVYPSSTAPALTSYATGHWPNQHAVPGWWTYLPEARLSTTILPFVERYEQQLLSDLGVSTKQVFPEPPLATRLRYEMAAMMPAKIAYSTYTRYVTGGSDIAGYERIDEAASIVAARVEQAGTSTYTYFYVPIIDALQHLHGPDAAEVARAVEEVQAVVESLARRVAGRARIIVTADHGLVRVAEEERHTYARSDALLELLDVPPTGEPRAPVFHVLPEHRDRFPDAFRRCYGEWFELLTASEAEELQLFGPPPGSDEGRRRLGDFAAVARGTDVLVDATMNPMIGYHGGLLPDEVRIPLILA